MENQINIFEIMLISQKLLRKISINLKKIIIIMLISLIKNPRLMASGVLHSCNESKRDLQGYAAISPLCMSGVGFS